MQLSSSTLQDSDRGTDHSQKKQEKYNCKTGHHLRVVQGHKATTQGTHEGFLIY